LSEQLQLRRGTGSQVASFTGAQGEVVFDTTNNRIVASDGVTVGGNPAAKLAEVITNTRTAVSDASYTVLATDRTVAYTALTAARAVALPASSVYSTGTRLLIVDETGNCSVTKTITVNAAGTDTIDGAPSAVVNQAFGFIGLESSGAGQWTIIDQGFMPATLNLAAAAHGANVQMQIIEQTVTLSGASTNASVPIPANCIVLAVGARVLTTISGAASYEVGVSTNLSQFGSLLSISVGSSNFGLIGPTAFYTNTTIIISAAGGSFTGGQVRLSISILLANPSAA
jgi:Major tropism determinant N-terminal domain